MRPYLRYIILIILIGLSTSASAQFGFRTKYSMNSFTDWNRIIQKSSPAEDDVLTSNIEFGLDYRFRMKNVRIDILHEIAIGLKTESILTNQSGVEFSYFAYNLNTQFYAFNLRRESGIDEIPKSGQAFANNLFFTISPGVLFNRTAVSSGPLLLPTIVDDQLNFKLGIGVGYDFKIGDSFIISPGIAYNFIHDLELILWPVSFPPSETDEATNLHQLQFQIRIGF